MNTIQTITTLILATAISYPVLAETGTNPSTATSTPSTEQAAAVPVVQAVPPTATEQDESSTEGWGWGCGKRARKDAMHKQMQKMDTHMTNIETLLQQLVDQNKK